MVRDGRRKRRRLRVGCIAFPFLARNGGDALGGTMINVRWVDGMRGENRRRAAAANTDDDWVLKRVSTATTSAVSEANAVRSVG